MVSKLQKYHPVPSFPLKPGVLHGNWPKFDLSHCLLIHLREIRLFVVIYLSFKWTFEFGARVIYGLFACGQGEEPICTSRMALYQPESWVTKLWQEIRSLPEEGARGQLLWLNFEWACWSPPWSKLASVNCQSWNWKVDLKHRCCFDILQVDQYPSWLQGLSSEALTLDQYLLNFPFTVAWKSISACGVMS